MFVENQSIRSKVTVPHKCESCPDLDYDPIRGFVCGQDRPLWGDFPRTLDWGAWRPDRPILILDGQPLIDQALIEAVFAGERVVAVRHLRRSSRQEISVAAARSMYQALRAQVERAGTLDSD